MGNAAQHCRLGLFQDSDFAGDLVDSRSTSREILCFFKRSFPLVGCARNETSVSHSSIEFEVISLDAGLRMDGPPALDLWNLYIELLLSSSIQPRARSNL